MHFFIHIHIYIFIYIYKYTYAHVYIQIDVYTLISFSRMRTCKCCCKHIYRSISIYIYRFIKTHQSLTIYRNLCIHTNLLLAHAPTITGKWFCKPCVNARMMIATGGGIGSEKLLVKRNFSKGSSSVFSNMTLCSKRTFENFYQS